MKALIQWQGAWLAAVVGLLLFIAAKVDAEEKKGHAPDLDAKDWKDCLMESR